MYFGGITARIKDKRKSAFLITITRITIQIAESPSINRNDIHPVNII